ncbi:MAG: diguanylate cyclase [Lachnospiraceae bacterium]|nr:diguanylate cyclase [Lachnospiraceae bacterium]
MEERVISMVFLYGSSKQLCLAIPTNGLTIMGERFKACLVQIDFQDIVDLLAFDDQGRTYFGLYSKTGVNLSDTELGPVVLDQNIIEATKPLLTGDKWKALREDFENSTEGSVFVSSGDIDATLSYVPIPGTDWEMLVLIRESVIHEQIRGVSEKNSSFSRYQIIFTMVSMLLFAGILLLMLRSISSKQLEAEKENSKNFLSMANTDSLTGIRNKHAYANSEDNINQGIREGRIDRLAMVVCDINGLKYVNDTQGHAAGDKLIRDASALICEYFSHGSVFRIGGDEFVVLLQGVGYDTMEEVVDAFNRKAEANIAARDVVVSIGCSKLESSDKQLNDVFERADRMMYERKQVLKAMGAKTRE